MDIGEFKNNKMYCEADFCEDEIILSLKENSEFNIHIWEGYIRDIFDKAALDGEMWAGFTRDFHEIKGAFSRKNGNKIQIQNIEEYLADLLGYCEKEFDFEETREVFNLMVDFLRYAMMTGQTVVVQIV